MVQTGKGLHASFFLSLTDRKTSSNVDYFEFLNKLQYIFSKNFKNFHSHSNRSLWNYANFGELFDTFIKLIMTFIENFSRFLGFFQKIKIWNVLDNCYERFRHFLKYFDFLKFVFDKWIFRVRKNVDT